MLTLLFHCLHNRDYTVAESADAPLIGEYGHCHKCGENKVVVGRSDCWVVKCRDCRYVTYQAELTASVKASAHMTRRRHRVDRWRQDQPDVITEHEPTPQPDNLFDIPPF